MLLSCNYGLYNLNLNLFSDVQFANTFFLVAIGYCVMFLISGSGFKFDPFVTCRVYYHLGEDGDTGVQNQKVLNRESIATYKLFNFGKLVKHCVPSPPY